MLPRPFITIALAASIAFAAQAAKAEPSSGSEPAVVRMTVEGPSLFTPQGMALYMNNAENTASPRFAWQCTDAVNRTTDDQQSGIGSRPEIGFRLLGSCLSKFPPYLAPSDAKPSGEFSIVRRASGEGQWAFRGFPLYFSNRDKAPGDRNGVSGGFFSPRGRGMYYAIVPVQLPIGLKMMRRAEGLVLVSSDTERAIYTRRGNARLQLASAGREDFMPILAPSIAQLSGDWSVVDDGAGSGLLAWRGKPLYRAAVSLNDVEIESARGWEPVVIHKAPPLPRAIKTRLTLLGDVYTDNMGKTLYTYSCNAGGFTARVSCDDQGDPAAFMVALCGDGKECARRWRPYMAPAGARPVGEFSTIEITYPMFTDMRGKLFPDDAPRVTAWAYRGRPLFTYYEDEKPGDIWGDRTGGIWGSLFNALQVPGRSATFFEP